jgi:hypothetical protein
MEDILKLTTDKNTQNINNIALHGLFDVDSDAMHPIDAVSVTPHEMFHGLHARNILNAKSRQC